MPTELQWFPTFNLPSGEPRSFPIVLGHELSGKVETLGTGVNNFKVGDEVYKLNDWFANGAQAEYCVASATALALVPESLDHVQSADRLLHSRPGRVYLNERICRRVSGFLFTEQPAAWELLPYNSLTGAAHESSPRPPPVIWSFARSRGGDRLSHISF